MNISNVFGDNEEEGKEVEEIITLDGVEVSHVSLGSELGWMDVTFSQGGEEETFGITGIDNLEIQLRNGFEDYDNQDVIKVREGVYEIVGKKVNQEVLDYLIINSFRGYILFDKAMFTEEQVEFWKGEIPKDSESIKGYLEQYKLLN